MCSKIVAALMAGSVGMCLGADAARALDLRDRNIWIATQRVYEAVDNPSKPPYVDRSKSGQNFRLVAGKIVSFGEYEGGCNQWLVYTPGRPSSGTVECKPKREGVSSDWTERSAIATFQTQFVGAGNVPTLKGEMKGSKFWRMNHCNRIFGNSKTDFTITETLKVRVTGETCQVLEYRRVKQEEVTKGDGKRELKRTVETPASPANCKITHPSEPPQQQSPKGPPIYYEGC